jgi:hypothetical protein
MTLVDALRSIPDRTAREYLTAVLADAWDNGYYAAGHDEYFGGKTDNPFRPANSIVR